MPEIEYEYVLLTLSGNFAAIEPRVALSGAALRLLESSSRARTCDASISRRSRM